MILEIIGESSGSNLFVYQTLNHDKNKNYNMSTNQAKKTKLIEKMI